MKVRFVRYRYSIADHRIGKLRSAPRDRPTEPFDPVDPGQTDGWIHDVQNGHHLAVKSEMYFNVESLDREPAEPASPVDDLIPGHDYRLEFESGDDVVVRQAIPVEIGAETSDRLQPTSSRRRPHDRR